MRVSRVDKAKQNLARKMRGARTSTHRKIGPIVATKIIDQFKIARGLGLEIGANTIVSAYWPVRDELDTRFLLQALHEDGVRCALPVLGSKDKMLIFRRWRPGDVLRETRFGLAEPAEDKPCLEPNVLLVPLLAVDFEGNRLGYGGGYYDFTLLRFRLQGERPVTAVGLAYEAQITSNVPHDLSDAKLDWLITEKHVIQFKS